MEIEVRTLASASELEASYRLRYDVYGSLGYVQRPNASRLEVDEYDPFSISFGAFAFGALVGTLRLIGREIEPISASVVRRLAASGDPNLAEAARLRRRRALPSLVSRRLAARVDRFNVGRAPVLELSRTIVRPTHRGSGVSRALMELGLARASEHGPVVLVGGCLPEHVPMYARYGYDILPGTGFDRYESVGRIANSVVCRTDVLPEPTRAHVGELRACMRAGVASCAIDLGRGTRAVHLLGARLAGSGTEG